MGFLKRIWNGNQGKNSQTTTTTTPKTPDYNKEQIKAAIHEAAQGYLFRRGDKMQLSPVCFQFILPAEIKPGNIEVLEHEASIGNPEAQWVWAIRYLTGYKNINDLPDPSIVGQRINNAAAQGVAAARNYLVDHFKSEGNKDSAIGWLAEALKIEENRIAGIISLEWKAEGYYFEQDPNALPQLILFAKHGYDRAKWYLGCIDIKY